MTWAELEKFIHNMSQGEKGKTAVCWDASMGIFFNVNGISEFNSNEPGVDYSLDVDTSESWY